MRDPGSWRPSKFVMTPRGLRASADPREVATGSRLTADLQARAYERALRDHGRGALLDLGCGRAPLYAVYKGLVSSVTCLDWANSYHDVGHADVNCDLGRGLPLPDGRFETVLATDVLEHVEEPGPLWSEIRRVLRGGGTLIAGVPFLYWVHEGPYDYHRYTGFKLRGFCRDAGLEVVALEPYGGAPEVVFDIVAKHAAVWPPLGRACYLLSRALALSGPVRSLSGRTAEKFPLGYLLVARKPEAE